MATHSCSCLENPRDGRAWWAAVSGVAQSRTRLKRLSSSNLHKRWRRACQPTQIFLLGESSWTEEPGRLQSLALQRVGHDWTTSFLLFTFMYWRRKWQPTPVFLPGESQGQQSVVACRLWGLTESDMTEATYHQQHTIFLWLMLHINIGNLFDF